jgi:ABC-type cobalamin/Fe3+-siderophores transport system ATPase subunit
MIKEGRALAAGPVEEVLTASRVRELYDVEVDIVHHGDFRLVVPHRPADAEPPA